MPRYYGRRRRQGRRYHRRNRALSTRNIYGNRSARSQATQIATLRNQVRGVWRYAKPEWVPIENIALINNRVLSGNIDRASQNIAVLSGTDFFEEELNNTHPPQYKFSGESIRLRKVEIYGTINFSNPSAAQIGLATGFCRVVLMLPKADIASYDNWLVNFDPFNDAVNVNQVFNGPLKTGISDDYVILADKTYRVNGGSRSLAQFRIPVHTNCIMRYRKNMLITEDEDDDGMHYIMSSSDVCCKNTPLLHVSYATTAGVSGYAWEVHISSKCYITDA